jgi:hypothetical protein
MKKAILTFTTACLLASSILIPLPGTQAEAAAKAKSYKNCTELNKDYPGGVAQSASVKNQGGKTKKKPHVSKELYAANKKLDRDKDLIACEK